MLLLISGAKLQKTFYPRKFAGVKLNREGWRS